MTIFNFLLTFKISEKHFPRKLLFLVISIFPENFHDTTTLLSSAARHTVSNYFAQSYYYYYYYNLLKRVVVTKNINLQTNYNVRVFTDALAVRVPKIPTQSRTGNCARPLSLLCKLSARKRRVEIEEESASYANKRRKIPFAHDIVRTTYYNNKTYCNLSMTKHRLPNTDTELYTSTRRIILCYGYCIGTDTKSEKTSLLSLHATFFF